jgi:hypothetical protein
MTDDPHDDDARGTDDDHHDARPVDAAACGAPGCRDADDLARVRRDDGAVRTLCPFHRKDFLGVSS